MKRYLSFPLYKVSCRVSCMMTNSDGFRHNFIVAAICRAFPLRLIKFSLLKFFLFNELVACASINPKTAKIYSNSIVRFLFFLHEQKHNPDAEIDESPLTDQFDDFMDANSELSDSNKRKLINEKLMVDPPPYFIDFITLITYLKLFRKVTRWSTVG